MNLGPGWLDRVSFKFYLFELTGRSELIFRTAFFQGRYIDHDAAGLTMGFANLK